MSCRLITSHYFRWCKNMEELAILILVYCIMASDTDSCTVYKVQLTLYYKINLPLHLIIIVDDIAALNCHIFLNTLHSKKPQLHK